MSAAIRRIGMDKAATRRAPLLWLRLGGGVAARCALAAELSLRAVDQGLLPPTTQQTWCGSSTAKLCD